MEDRHDTLALQWQDFDDDDAAVQLQSIALQENIRKNHIRHQNEKNALERNNTKLLNRVEELERLHEDLKRQLEAAIGAGTSPVSPVEPLSEVDTNQQPRSSATVPTQEATVPLHEHRELVRLYNEALRENDELRRNSERLATQHDLMKARVKEWSTWASKERAKRGKFNREHRNGKHRKSFPADAEAPPTPTSVTSPFLQGRETPRLGDNADDIRQEIAEQASRLLEYHESPLKGHLTVEGSAAETTGCRGFHLSEAGLEVGLPKANVDSQSENTARQEPTVKSSDLQGPRSRHSDSEDTLLYARHASPRVTSSQTTQDADDGFEHMKIAEEAASHHQPDDDVPTIVSERSLKRKHPANVEVYQDPRERHTEPPLCIKRELQDTETMPHGIPTLLSRTSTMDLDQIGLVIQTPRKRRRMQDIIWNPPLQGYSWSRSRPPLRSERSSSLPLSFGWGSEAQDIIKGEEQDENLVWEVPESDPSPAAEDDGSLGAADSIFTRSPDNPRKSKALRYLDANVRVQPQSKHLRVRHCRTTDEERGAKAIPMLAEDGEEAQIRDPSSAKMQESRRRFAELYNNPPPERKALASPRTPTTGRPTRTMSRKNAGNASSTTPGTCSALQSKKKALVPGLPTPQTNTKNPRPAISPRPQPKRKVPGPLRGKPVSDLQLSDFKINPATNAGLDFAYSEVIRSREARRCLPGCTKTECCGRDLRTMVEAGLNPPLPRSFWDDSQSSQQQPYTNEQEENDHRYLQWFMGTSYHRDRVDAMPAVMREDLVVQAKVKLLANQAGRHRQAHQRSRTPPGFWRADFPATQELEKDREEARKREREAVEERWREAMIEGGRWLFRDE